MAEEKKKAVERDDTVVDALRELTSAVTKVSEELKNLKVAQDKYFKSGRF